MKSLEKEVKGEFSSLSNQIQALFDRQELNILAEELGFIKRQGKIDALDFILAVSQALNEYGGGCSLTHIGHVLSRELGVIMQNESINNRFNEAALKLAQELLTRVMKLAINSTLSSDVLLDSFNGIYIEDASNINLPDSLASQFKGYGSDASDAALKINLRYDLQGNSLAVRIKEATDNDQNGLTFGAPFHSLWIRDLGYFKYEEFKGLAKQEAFFLSRLAKSANAYKNNKYRCSECIDFEKLAAQLQDGEIYEEQVFLGYEKRWPARLVVVKLPADKAAKREAKMLKHRKRKGKKVTAQALSLNCINIYITNLCAKDWSGEQIFQLYTIRWQVEIMFKAWKSVYEIDEVKKNIKPQRALFQFYIQLIQVLINSKILLNANVLATNTEAKEISQIKGVEIIKGYLKDIFRSMLCSVDNIAQVIEQKIDRLLNELLQRACKNRNRRNANKLYHIC
jgi:hypothetical protein